MSRVPRSQLDDGVFHVTARGAGGTPIFLHDTDRLDFLGLLQSTAHRFDWRCHAYCLMSTHYHLVLESARLPLSLGMHHLNGAHARRFNRRHDRHGHLFAGRFSAYVIQDESYLEAACRYVLENPVRAGLSPTVEAWPWSGFAASGPARPAGPTYAPLTGVAAGFEASASPDAAPSGAFASPATSGPSSGLRMSSAHSLSFAWRPRTSSSS
jgi:putative transposase